MSSYKHELRKKFRSITRNKNRLKIMYVCQCIAYYEVHSQSFLGKTCLFELQYYLYSSRRL